MAGDLAVIVPACNEAATVAEIIRRFQTFTVVRQNNAVEVFPIPSTFKSGIP